MLFNEFSKRLNNLENRKNDSQLKKINIVIYIGCKANKGAIFTMVQLTI
jgi:hypothetical protein